MQHIVELAERLGKAIAESPQTQALNAARAKMNANAETVQILADYQGHVEKVAQLESDNRPIEVEDKQKLKGYEESLLGRAEFKAFTAAQVEYVDLMRKVNDAMHKQLAGAEGDQAADG